MNMASKVTLRTLFSTALRNASEALKRPSLQDKTQDLINLSLTDCNAVMHGIDISGVFSPNETFDDLSTSSIPYLALNYVVAELINKLRTTDREERMRNIADSSKHLHIFIGRIHQYGIASKQDQKLYSKRLKDVKDPTKRRDLKIQQFKAEKEIKNRLEALSHRKSNSFPLDTEWDVIRFILALSDLSPENADEEPNEEVLRETYALLIRLIWMHSETQLESFNSETELLRTAPPSPSLPHSKLTEDTTAWRLDSSIGTGVPDGRGPLMDSSGRPLRPFTILPGNASDRGRFQAQVFRPDHRLPTVTVDEYLEREKQMGNIISGGGPQSLNAPTKAEQLTVGSEMDGTVEGEMKAEEKRQNDERWAEYADYHPKGEGNTMNRG